MVVASLCSNFGDTMEVIPALVKICHRNEILLHVYIPSQFGALIDK